jgi:hypothetical protein
VTDDSRFIVVVFFLGVALEKENKWESWSAGLGVILIPNDEESHPGVAAMPKSVPPRSSGSTLQQVRRSRRPSRVYLPSRLVLRIRHSSWTAKHRRGVLFLTRGYIISPISKCFSAWPGGLSRTIPYLSGTDPVVRQRKCMQLPKPKAAKRVFPVALSHGRQPRYTVRNCFVHCRRHQYWAISLPDRTTVETF